MLETFLSISYQSLNDATWCEEAESLCVSPIPTEPSPGADFHPTFITSDLSTLSQSTPDFPCALLPQQLQRKHVKRMICINNGIDFHNKWTYFYSFFIVIKQVWIIDSLVLCGQRRRTKKIPYNMPILLYIEIKIRNNQHILSAPVPHHSGIQGSVFCFPALLLSLMFPGPETNRDISDWKHLLSLIDAHLKKWFYFFVYTNCCVKVPIYQDRVWRSRAHCDVNCIHK